MVADAKEPRDVRYQPWVFAKLRKGSSMTAVFHPPWTEPALADFEEMSPVIVGLAGGGRRDHD
jgi:hypothetical protein